MCLNFLGRKFHCFLSFLLMYHPSFQIMRQKEQSGVLKAKATGKAPLSVAASSGANSRSTTGNQIWTIYTNQLTLFYGRFDGNVSHKAQLQVRLVSDQVHCKVEFRDTPNTTVNKNLLSTLNLKWSSSSTDRQVSQLFNLFRKTDWKN